MAVPQAEGAGLRITVPARIAACLLAVSAAGAATRPVAAQSRTHVLIVAGIGGEQQYRTMFFEWGSTMARAAVERWGVAPADVTFLTEQPERDSNLADGRSTKEEVEKALARIAANAGSDDVVFILLIGHGSYLNGESRISLPGPDLTAADFATLVDRLGSRRVVFVNAASASGEFLKAVSGPNRVVITSTKSGMERNLSKFGGWFVAAFAEDVADTDKDGAVSMAEAFEYARIETGRAYESAKTLLTEHAVIDDNGDGRGSTELTQGGEDGALAKVTFLGSGAVVAGVEAPAGASPALRALYEQKKKLDQQLADLRAMKDTMDPERYESELERLLTDIAVKSREIRRMEGGGGT